MELSKQNMSQSAQVAGVVSFYMTAALVVSVVGYRSAQMHADDYL